MENGVQDVIVEYRTKMGWSETECCWVCVCWLATLEAI